MSLDRSLKQASGLARHRNVLTRAERIERLTKLKRFDLSSGEALGLPKVANRKMAASKGAKKEAAAEAAPAAGAAAAAAAPAAKAAAPAAKGKK